MPKYSTTEDKCFNFCITKNFKLLPGFIKINIYKRDNRILIRNLGGKSDVNILKNGFHHHPHVTLF